MIDSFSMSLPFLLWTCETIPPLANSDHLGLLLQAQWRQIRQPAGGANRTICLYKHADWHKAHELIESTNWDSLLMDDVNVFWDNWLK